MTQTRFFSQRRLPVIVDVVALVGIVALLWLPFGFHKMIGLQAEWAIIAQHLRGDSYDVRSTRPIYYVPFVLAYQLTPDSFVGYNVVMLLLFLGKALVFYDLLRLLLPGIRFAPLLGAILFILYPADFNLFTFRALSSQVTIFAALVAIDLFLRAWRGSRWSYWLWPLIWLAQAISMGLKELMYPLLFSAPLLLVWWERRLSRRVARFVALWYLVPLLFVLNMVIVLIRGEGEYVSLVIEQGMGRGESTLPRMLNSVRQMYEYHVTGWLRAFQQLDSPFLGLALVAGALVGVICAWHLWRMTENHHSGRWYVGIVAAGLVVMLLGFAAFLPTRVRGDIWRTYYVTPAGAVLIVIALLYALTRLRHAGKIFVSVLAGVLVLLAMSNALAQQRYLVSSSATVQRVLAAVAEQAPGFGDETTIALVDPTGIYESSWTLGGRGPWQTSLYYLYERPISAIYCGWQNQDCNFGIEGIGYERGDREVTFSYDAVLIFEALPDGRVTLRQQSSEMDYLPAGVTSYQPEALIDPTVGPPPKAHTFFTCWPLSGCIDELL
ncbi:MAG: hypothetical protein K8L99_11665 [Anaerolineae bacterium]|nr:hypothetical protein [Anaerolineae bacterium]